MNYLAHIFLSGNDGKAQVGNFIGDAVKGSSYRSYQPAIRDGILLHRAIDTYTDHHPAIRETIRSLRPFFGRYSAIVLDMYFDYLLASRFGEFTDLPLHRFCRRFYLQLILHRRHLPDRIKGFMWHFIGTDRLGRYRKTSGIRESLEIMVIYHRIDVRPDVAVNYLISREEELWSVFKPFFDELRHLCEGYLSSPDRPGYLKTSFIRR